MPRLDVCPLCGATAAPTVPMIGVFLIRCSNSDCGCSVGGQNLDDAAERWNRRLPERAYVEPGLVDRARQAADAEDLRDNARHELLLLLAQLVAGTMLRPDAGLLIYLDDGRSTTRHIPVNVREKLLQLMSAVGT